jgi:hypothetical protein
MVVVKKASVTLAGRRVCVYYIHDVRMYGVYRIIRAGICAMKNVPYVVRKRLINAAPVERAQMRIYNIITTTSTTTATAMRRRRRRRVGEGAAPLVIRTKGGVCVCVCASACIVYYNIYNCVCACKCEHTASAARETIGRNTC